MDDTAPAPRRATRWWRGPSATITASLIGGVCAVLAATLPPLLTRQSDAPPSPQPLVAATKASVPNLTLGAWTLHDAVDNEGFNFADSTLKFTSQEPTQDGALLTGFFEWREQSKLLGRENFVARYVAETRHLFIEGKAVENVEGNLGVGSFSAVLTADGRKLTDGTWGSTPGNVPGIPGSWNARR
ncbi:MAG: hypothetical protein C0483_21250 [Pirellula sp.]|nr:hypothetical protein [Pirellula sp.]